MGRGAEPPADDAYVVRDVSTMRALFDPLRLRIMGELTSPRTAKELGAALDIEPNKLYYHLRRLEEHGLVAVDRSGAERRFRASSTKIALDPELRPSDADASSFVAAVFGEAQRQIQGAISQGGGADAPGGSVSISHVGATLSPSKLARYQARLRQLVEDLESEPVSTAKGAAEHSLLVALFPTGPTH